MLRQSATHGQWFVRPAKTLQRRPCSDVDASSPPARVFTHNNALTALDVTTAAVCAREKRLKALQPGASGWRSRWAMRCAGLQGSLGHAKAG